MGNSTLGTLFMETMIELPLNRCVHGPVPFPTTNLKHLDSLGNSANMQRISDQSEGADTMLAFISAGLAEMQRPNASILRILNIVDASLVSRDKSEAPEVVYRRVLKGTEAVPGS